MEQLVGAMWLNDQIMLEYNIRSNIKNKEAILLLVGQKWCSLIVTVASRILQIT